MFRRLIMSLWIIFAFAAPAFSGTVIPQTDLRVDERFPRGPDSISGSSNYEFPNRCFGSPCGVIGGVEISTSNNWKTAELLYSAQDLFSPNNSRASGFALVGIDAVTEVNNAFEEFGSLIFQNSGPIQFLIGNNTTTAWQALNGGFSIEQFFFGNEFTNYADIRLTNRNRSEYSFTLWDVNDLHPNPIPLPASMSLALLGLMGLFGLKRRTS